ncbi:MAG: demethylmenaquinone methyltransferase/2-methoxy-6-polyprenyl-1,4-benzoquinol methylase [Planctomycetota bacterium]|jgi:demethylmenaquinone methyltransferase/2-methoxy-6-polyprenyl-1,4-benzoquinol methylase
MFARIAGRYDLLNRTLSLGIDQRWRKRALALAGDVRGKTVVDVCAGTGDLTALFTRAGARVVGADFTHEMLQHALPKHPGVPEHMQMVTGDAMYLPVRSSVADVASVAFGIRNVADRAAGFREMQRVLKPGGKMICLEFTTPDSGLFAWLYRTYFTQVLPRIGRLISRDNDAYSYLPRTVLAWPKAAELQRELEQLGYTDCGHRQLTRGIACLHWGTAP